ncbi:hypothetical protein [Dyella terrae]|uniref:hypothetical protein n=1 Tax=Dyella terrae TaxID=522259 RepID=UPI001EFDC26A|nr:hypothetical protein [Dyella terrae]ULU24981.1 hypothetical protein DYST_01901 [Dyella terrae]
MDYVESVLARAVIVHCESDGLRERLEGTTMPGTQSVAIAYSGKPELANVLTSLQSLKVPFVSAGPNPPSDVFELLAAEGLVAGSVDRVFWRSPGEPIVERL